MLKNEPLPYPDIIKLFNFLDSETIAARNWIKLYLAKQGVFLEPNPANIESVRVNLVQIFTSQGRTQADIELFARKMGNAWRVKKHRQSKGRVSVSLTLDNSVAAHLSQMSKGKTKTDVITRLIQGNYQEFLTQENIQKAKLAEKKNILQMQRESNKFEKRFSKPSVPTQQPSLQLELLQAKADDLRSGIAKLYDLIFSAHEQGQTIEDQFLLEATKIYYAAFNK